jgi:hypothetical protein
MQGYAGGHAETSAWSLGENLLVKVECCDEVVEERKVERRGRALVMCEIPTRQFSERLGRSLRV